jgi:hypothetical protein
VERARPDLGDQSLGEVFGRSGVVVEEEHEGVPGGGVVLHVGGEPQEAPAFEMPVSDGESAAKGAEAVPPGGKTADHFGIDVIDEQLAVGEGSQEGGEVPGAFHATACPQSTGAR